MATIVLHPGVVTLDDSGGVPRIISNQVTDVQINTEKNIGSFHVLGNDWEQQSQGGKRATADVEFIETQPTNEAHQLFRDWLISGLATVTRTLTVDAPDSLTGSMRYSGETVIVNINPLHKGTGGAGDPVKSRASLKYHNVLSASVIV